MNWKFWNWQWGTENRSGFTDLIIDAVIREAEGEVRTASATAALELASGIYGNAFAVASHTGPQALTPSMLSEAARRLVRHGESVWLIEVRNGSLVLLPCSSWTITGGVNEDEWTYRCEVSGPTKSVARNVGSDGVLHLRYSTDPLSPWSGNGPMQSASVSASLAGKLEQKLDDESSAPSALVIPTPPATSQPDGSSSDPNKQLRADVAKAKGGILMADTMADGFGKGIQAAPRKDWTASRLGPEIQENMVQLRRETFEDVLKACQIPPALFAGNGSAQAMRETYRLWVLCSVQGLAKRIEEEVRKKLETEIEFDFRPLFLSNLGERANAFKRFVDAGMSEADARELAGL